MLGGVTRHMLPHLSGVPHLHLNRPLSYTLGDTQYKSKCFILRLHCRYATIYITSSFESLSTLTEEGYSRRSYRDSRHAGMANSNSIRQSRDVVEKLLGGLIFSYRLNLSYIYQVDDLKVIRTLYVQETT